MLQTKFPTTPLKLGSPITVRSIVVGGLLLLLWVDDVQQLVDLLRASAPYGYTTPGLPLGWPIGLLLVCVYLLQAWRSSCSRPLPCWPGIPRIWLWGWWQAAQVWQGGSPLKRGSSPQCRCRLRSTTTRWMCLRSAVIVFWRSWNECQGHGVRAHLQGENAGSWEMIQFSSTPWTAQFEQPYIGSITSIGDDGGGSCR